MGTLGPPLALLFRPEVLALVVSAGVCGLAAGAVARLGPAATVALLAPLALYVDPMVALTAIIVAGTVAAVFHAEPAGPSAPPESDMPSAPGGTDRGTAAAVGSLAGAVVLTAALSMAGPVVRLGPAAFFWVAIFAMSAAVLTASAAPMRALLSLLIGLLLSTSGPDRSLGFPRFTFGRPELLTGLQFLPVILGLLVVSRVIRAVVTASAPATEPDAARSAYLGPRARAPLRTPEILRWGAFGALTGMIPGAGAEIAGRLAPPADEQGAQPGGHAPTPAAAGDVARHAGMATAWLPTLLLGVPADAVTAIVVGLFFMKSMAAGGRTALQQGEMLSGTAVAFLAAAALLIPLWRLAGALGLGALRASRGIVWPGVLLAALTGAYAAAQSLFDVGVLLAVGVVGYALLAAGYPLGPALMGLVLGPVAEQQFMLAMAGTRWNVPDFLLQPPSLVGALLTAALWLLSLAVGLADRGAGQVAPGAPGRKP
ncbi:MAG: tripartite tricarboxylate transporter permease [Armatimonadetes bacterium]|nr:tripartite tricarboxylate transporter permease [Armatimonadota bacterium]